MQVSSTAKQEKKHYEVPLVI